MSRNRAILLVVEGEKAEPELMARLFSVYGIADVDSVYTYRANVYDLYRRMFEGDEGAEDLSLMLTLRERESDPEKRRLLSRNYSDVILIFDFDPQDHLFSMEKLAEMVGYFNESTDHGKLYVNYPMVEAHRDLIAMPYDDTYLQRTARLSDLRDGSYKELVGGRSALPRLEDCDVVVFSQMLLQNIEKASSLIGCNYNKSDPAEHYDALSQDAIMRAQERLITEQSVVGVLCTCLWFAIDYGPKRMRQSLKKFAV